MKGIVSNETFGEMDISYRPLKKEKCVGENVKLKRKPC